MRPPHRDSEVNQRLLIHTVSTPASKAFSAALEGAWADLVKARETRGLFRALPRERRETFFRLHDQLVVGLSGAARYDPATVTTTTLQAWIWASAENEGEAHDLETALHALLFLAIEQGLRPHHAFPRWRSNSPLPSAPYQ